MMIYFYTTHASMSAVDLTKRQILSLDEQQEEPFIWTVKIETDCYINTEKINFKKPFDINLLSKIPHGTLHSTGILIAPSLVLMSEHALLSHTFIHCTIKHLSSDQQVQGVRYHLLNKNGKWKSYSKKELSRMSFINQLKNRFFDLVLVELDHPMHIKSYPKILEPSIIEAILGDDQMIKLFAGFGSQDGLTGIMRKSELYRTKGLSYLEVLNDKGMQFLELINQNNNVVKFQQLANPNHHAVDSDYLIHEDFEDDLDWHSALFLYLILQMMEFNYSPAMPNPWFIWPSINAIPGDSGSGFFVKYRDSWVLTGILKSHLERYNYNTITPISACVYEKIIKLQAASYSQD